MRERERERERWEMMGVLEIENYILPTYVWRISYLWFERVCVPIRRIIQRDWERMSKREKEYPNVWSPNMSPQFWSKSHRISSEIVASLQKIWATTIPVWTYLLIPTTGGMPNHRTSPSPCTSRRPCTWSSSAPSASSVTPPSSSLSSKEMPRWVGCLNCIWTTHLTFSY